MIEQHIYHFFINDFFLKDYVIVYVDHIINKVSILFQNLIEFIILLYTFLEISFAVHKEYIISLILFSKFSDVLPDFTCPSDIGSL